MFKKPRFSTNGGSDLGHKKPVGQVSTSLRCLTSKDGDLFSYFGKIDEDENFNTALKQILIENFDILASKLKIKGHLSLKQRFGFCKFFSKIN